MCCEAASHSIGYTVCIFIFSMHLTNEFIRVRINAYSNKEWILLESTLDLKTHLIVIPQKYTVIFE